MNLPITLSSSDSLPLHRQLTKELRGLITSGQLPSGRRLPSTRVLASALCISRATASLAYEQLLREGFVEAYSGSGTFVARDIPSVGGVGERIHHYGDGAVPVEECTQESFSPMEPYGSVDFRPNASSNEQMPLQQWRKLVAQRMAQMSIPDYCNDARGYLQLRETIARHLQRNRGVKCSPDQVFVLSSVQQALTLIARVHVQRGTTVAVENPGYVTARRIFEARGANIHPVPVDEHGLVTEQLPAAQEAGAKLVYVTPSHQVPTGTALALLRRLELLKWAQRNSAVVIEDDYGSEYKYSGNAVPAMQSYGASESVVYMGTFSKIMFPSLRIAYLVVPKGFIRAYSAAKRLLEDRSPMVEQCALSDFIADGYLDRLMRRNKSTYAVRRQALVRALDASLSGVATVISADVGTHVMVRFKTAMPEEEILQRAAENGVVLASTRENYIGETRPRAEFVFSFAHLTEEQIALGIERLAAVFTGFGGTTVNAPITNNECIRTAG